MHKGRGLGVGTKGFVLEGPGLDLGVGILAETTSLQTVHKIG